MVGQFRRALFFRTIANICGFMSNMQLFMNEDISTQGAYALNDIIINIYSNVGDSIGMVLSV